MAAKWPGRQYLTRFGKFSQIRRLWHRCYLPADQVAPVAYARLGIQLMVGGETTGGKIATFEVLRALPYTVAEGLLAERVLAQAASEAQHAQ
jgi:hypothetical protein